MKRVVGIAMALLLVTTLCYAQTARSASPVTAAYEGNTGLANLSLYGLDKSGNPGWIALAGAASVEQSDVGTTGLPSESPIMYFLWVDETGDLCIASLHSIHNNTNFPNGDWTSYTGCTVVGGQS